MGLPPRLALTCPSFLWGRDERSSLLGWPAVGRSGGDRLSKRNFSRTPCATPTRRFAPPSPQGGGIRPGRHQSSFISPLDHCSRNLNFWILPDPVSGMVSRTTNGAGFCAGRCARAYSDIASRPHERSDMRDSREIWKIPDVASLIRATLAYPSPCGEG